MGTSTVKASTFRLLLWNHKRSGRNPESLNSERSHIKLCSFLSGRGEPELPRHRSDSLPFSPPLNIEATGCAPVRANKQEVMKCEK
jgi:hypothetical protein